MTKNVYDLLLFSFSAAKKPKMIHPNLNDPRVSDLMSEIFMDVQESMNALPSHYYLSTLFDEICPNTLSCVNTEWRSIGSQNKLQNYLDDTKKYNNPTQEKEFFEDVTVDKLFFKVGLSKKANCMQKLSKDNYFTRELTFSLLQKQGGQENSLIELPIEQIDLLIGSLKYLRKEALKVLVYCSFLDHYDLLKKCRDKKMDLFALVVECKSKLLFERGINLLKADSGDPECCNKKEIVGLKNEVNKKFKLIENKLDNLDKRPWSFLN